MKDIKFNKVFGIVNILQGKLTTIREVVWFMIC